MTCLYLSPDYIDDEIGHIWGPGKVLISLVRYARPIAERAGDVVP
jgi:hypothetical protein